MRYVAALFFALSICLVSPITAEDIEKPGYERVELATTLHNLGSPEILQVGIMASRDAVSGNEPWEASLWMRRIVSISFGAQSFNSWELRPFDLPPKSFEFSRKGNRVSFRVDLNECGPVPIECRSYNGTCGMVLLADLGGIFTDGIVDLTWEVGEAIPGANGVIDVTYTNSRREKVKAQYVLEPHYAYASGAVLGYVADTFWLNSGQHLAVREAIRMRTSMRILPPMLLFPSDPTLPPEP
ncbi:MAG: hypothetical protein AAB490_00115 [Patescibacteria group bacterium]